MAANIKWSALQMARDKIEGVALGDHAPPSRMV